MCLKKRREMAAVEKRGGHAPFIVRAVKPSSPSARQRRSKRLVKGWVHELASADFFVLVIFSQC